jgi:hypothetical protein
MINLTNSGKGELFHSLEHFTQIAEDWETQPIIDVKIVSEAVCPSEFPE